MAFDRQLDALEADVPAPYSKEATFGPEPNKDPTRCLRAFMIHACLAQERLRLHRPYQTRSYYEETFRFSRDTCIAAAQQIITIHASPVLNQAVWASMNYKVRENLKLVSPRRSSDVSLRRPCARQLCSRSTSCRFRTDPRPSSIVRTSGVHWNGLGRSLMFR